MRRLDKVKGSGNPLGVTFPQTQGIGGRGYATMQATVYPHYDDFLDITNDTDEWAPATSLGTGGATITFASSFAVLSIGTGTAATVTLDMNGAQSAGNNIYNIPFRATFFARISTSAGAGVAPTGGLNVYMGMRDTGQTHIVQYRLALATAGGSSLANPVVNAELRQGSTNTAFISSASVNLFNSAAGRTCTSLTGYSVEVTHRSVTYSVIDDPHTQEEGRVIAHFNKSPRIDYNYVPFFSIVGDGTGGYTQTASVYLEMDAVRIEQFSHTTEPLGIGPETSSQKTVNALLVAQALGSASGSLVTSGAGVFLGYGVGSTGTTGADLFFAAWDSSAAGSTVYDYSNNASAGARLLWYAQVQAASSAGADAFGGVSAFFPPEGIPFHRGLVVGSVTGPGSAVGSSALNALVNWRA